MIPRRRLSYSLWTRENTAYCSVIVRVKWNTLLEVINLDPAKNGKIQSVGVRGEVDSVEPMIHSLNLQGSNEMSLLSLLRGKDSRIAWSTQWITQSETKFTNQ